MHALAFFFIALAQVSFAVLSALQCDNCNRGQIDKVAQLESNNQRQSTGCGPNKLLEAHNFFVLLRRRIFVFETLHITPRRHTSLTQACSRRSDSRAGKKNSRRKKRRERLEGKGGGNACKHSLTELFPPLIDRRPRNCDMNYKVLTG